MNSLHILICKRSYLPGYKAGGPIRSLSNLVDRLGSDFAFSIFTTDRDSGDNHAYPGVDLSHWNKVGKARVYYFTLNCFGFFRFIYLLLTTPRNILFLNSLFDPVYTVVPLIIRSLHLGPSAPTVIAPRGELSAGALGLKQVKKRTFLAFAKFIRLYQGVVWQASSEYEKSDIISFFGTDQHIIIAPNIPCAAREVPSMQDHFCGRSSALQLVFLPA